MDTKVEKLKKILTLEQKVGKWFTETFCFRRPTLIQICAGDKLPKESNDDPYLFFVSIGWLHKEAQDDPELMKILVENEL